MPCKHNECFKLRMQLLNFGTINAIKHVTNISILYKLSVIDSGYCTNTSAC